MLRTIIRQITRLIAALAMNLLIITAANASGGWTDYGTIGAINQQGSVTPGNEMVFVTVPVTNNPMYNVTGNNGNLCSLQNDFYFAVTTDLQKRLFAMLLMAKATGQKIRLWTTGNCHLWGNAEIQGMVIP